MKLVNAIWEKRNLNLDTIEITISDADRIDDINEILRKTYHQFAVLKLPTNRSDLIYPIQLIGFKFNEIIYNCRYRNLQKPELSSVEQKFLNNLSYSVIQPNEFEQLFSEINKEIFKTDRISLSPHFGTRIASKRYIGLVNDELERGSIVYILRYKNLPVGFFLFNSNTNYSVSNLAGIYSEFQGKGFGYYLNYFQIIHSSKLILKEHRTSFSSNNFGADRIHKKLGFEVYESYNVFSKH
jgi:hypothetical protein